MNFNLLMWQLLEQTMLNFYCNKAMSILFATKVEDSRVIVTSIEFTNIEEKSIETKELYKSIERNSNNIQLEYRKRWNSKSIY